MRTTKEKIIDYITKHQRVSPKELVDYLRLSQRAVFKQIRNLFLEGILDKIGTPPKVYYSIKETKKPVSPINLKEDDLNYINQHFYTITPLGIEMQGIEGFAYWCEKRKLSIEKMAMNYKKTRLMIDTYKKNGLIDGTDKLKKTFNQIYIHKLYYSDFYAIERFGKTKLGFILLYAKQSQSLPFIHKIIEMIQKPIQQIIKTHNIDAIGFVPHTVKREIQLMSICKDTCHFDKRILNISKIKTPIIIPQKTLSKLEDRIQNAKHTMIVKEKSRFKNILLIDDAVGSGATIHEISKQLYDKGIFTQTCTAFAITGSFKGFDVISEV